MPVPERGSWATAPARRLSRALPAALLALLALGLVAATALGLRELALAEAAPVAAPRPVAPSPRETRPVPAPAATPAAAAPINTAFPGLTTFRGNASRTYYGEGPVPRDPRVLWRYPREGALCSRSTDEHGARTWCGLGWTGQPNVIRHAGGRVELRFGAYDGRYHFLDAASGKPLRPALATGDLAKGSATTDPDGYPLYYAGSRDNRLRVIALDRGAPEVLWSLDAQASVPRVVWNDDWDGAPLVIGDYLIEGGENSWLYVIRLNRGYRTDGKVRVRPRVAARIPGWDERLLRDLGDERVSIESSVAYRDGVVYFANSGGLVQGWDISDVLAGGSETHRVFRFWTGDDTDASVVVDERGHLYVASQLERGTARSLELGQLLELDPSRPRNPLVWSLPVRERGFEGKGGIWATPALDRGMLYVATNAGGLLGVERRTGRVLWRIPLPGPTWSSPVVVDGVLLQGDCAGVLHAYDVSRQRVRPPELWSVDLGGCIEATPAVWHGRIYVGTRGGALYALGDRP
ncbi:MAG: PQQ-binding-like beta-propeller repeat protein [Thermoleophilia bacterium]|nr:PQQ-binding-like beta-propeller repeat protein [Thermoleophilia bacterium]